MPSKKIDKINVKAVEKYLLTLQDPEKLICRECGRINPPCGFEPLWGMAVGPGIAQISGNLCLDCDKRMRKEYDNTNSP